MNQAKTSVKALIGLAILIFACTAFGQHKPAPEDLEFNLITIGLGPGVEARYGHTILQIKNLSSKESLNLNWGTFHFDDPMLPINFFMGRLRYWLSNWKERNVFRKYQYIDRRRVEIQKINLNPQQKNQLYQLAIENLEPENTHFWYHFFYKNCSTFPRDLLNQVTNDKLKEILEPQLVGLTFRDYVRNYLSSPFHISFFLEITMNSTIDFEINKWQESFMPPRLSEHLSDLPYIDETGKMDHSKKLLSKAEVYYEGEQHPPSPLTVPYWICVFFIIFGSVYYNVRRKRPKIAEIAWRVVFSAFLFLSSIFGLIMTLAWVFSEHEVLKHNANLFYFWPTDFLLIFLLSLKARKKFSKLIHYYSMAHLLGLFMASILYYTGLCKQDISLVQLFAYPAFLTFYLPLILNGWKNNESH